MAANDESQKQRNLWSEVLGTFLGFLPYVVVILGWAISVETRNARMDNRVENLEKNDTAFAQTIKDSVNTLQDRVKENGEALDKRITAVGAASDRRLERIEDSVNRLINRSIPTAAAQQPTLSPGIAPRTGAWRDGRDLNR